MGIREWGEKERGGGFTLPILFMTTFGFLDVSCILLENYAVLLTSVPPSIL